MDCLETWEIPFTSTWEQTGSLGRRLNNDPGPKAPSTFRERKPRDTKRGGRVDLGSEANKRPGMRSGKS